MHRNFRFQAQVAPTQPRRNPQLFGAAHGVILLDPIRLQVVSSDHVGDGCARMSCNTLLFI
jgi:hypothetical protein